jgi:hypothetical protein
MKTMKQRFARVLGGVAGATLFTVSIFGVGLVGLGGVASANPPPSASKNTSTDVKELQAERVQAHALFDRVEAATAQVKARLKTLSSKGDNISVADMLEMQMLMNHLAQLADTSSTIVSDSNRIISSLARGVKS